MNKRELKKVRKASKILAKIEKKQKTSNELRELCRELLNKLDVYVQKQTGSIILRRYRYFTFEVDDIQEATNDRT